MGTNFEDNYLWSYFRELRWDEAKQFSYLCHESKGFLSFLSFFIAVVIVKNLFK